MRLLLSMLIPCLLAMSCDSPSSSPSQRVPADTVQGPGIIRGKVFISVPPPPLAPLKNEPCCEGAPATVPNESVIVNPDNTLANAVVQLKGGPKTEGHALPPAHLDQVYCRYTPHVVGVVVGQTLNIKSSDPTVHNVHYKSSFSGDTNHWMKTAGESVDVTFKAPEVVRTGCDVHPWMSAYIFVHDNPLFSITGETGEFEIKNIPVGEYQLVVWHERLGKIEQKITITPDAASHHVDLTFAPPGR